MSEGMASRMWRAARRRLRASLSVGLWLALSGYPMGALAEQITIAVASNFTAPMGELVTAFEAQSPHRIAVSFGSSGKFYAQIAHGAPFALFFSADQSKPAALEQRGLVVPGSRFSYAIGALALWSATPGLVGDSPAVLQENRFNKLALANPALAPYGEAALDVLEHLGLKEGSRAKWVKGENIAQAYQFVATGNADIGFVAASQILQGDKLISGSAWLIPRDLYRPIRQDAVLLRRGEHSAAARAFLAFVRGDEAAGIIRRYGYRLEGDGP